MMLSPFRSNQSFASLLLFGYALLLQLPYLVLGGQEPLTAQSEGYVGNWLAELMGSSYWLARLLPPVLVAVAGILANSYCDRYRLARIPTQLPGLLVVLFWGVVPAFHPFDPQQLCCLLMLIAVVAMGRTYRQRATEVARFDVGLLIGVASLLQPSYLYFFPAFVLGIAIFESASPRRILQLAIGTVIPYFLVGVYAYLRGDLPSFYRTQLAGFGWPVTAAPTGWYDLIALDIMVVPLLVVVLTGGVGRSLLNIDGAKNVSFICWLLLFSVPVALGTATVEPADAQAAVPFLGILAGLWLDRQPRTRAELFHLLYFAAAVLCSTLMILGIE